MKKYILLLVLCIFIGFSIEAETQQQIYKKRRYEFSLLYKGLIKHSSSFASCNKKLQNLAKKYSLTSPLVDLQAVDCLSSAQSLFYRSLYILDFYSKIEKFTQIHYPSVWKQDNLDLTCLVLQKGNIEKEYGGNNVTLSMFTAAFISSCIVAYIEKKKENLK